MRGGGMFVKNGPVFGADGRVRYNISALPQLPSLPLGCLLLRSEFTCLCV